jgi:hypothetical protein
MTTPDLASMARTLVRRDLTTGTGIWKPPNSSRVIVHILPGNLDEADRVAARNGYERVDDELDRRTFKPMNENAVEDS